MKVQLGKWHERKGKRSILVKQEMNLKVTKDVKSEGLATLVYEYGDNSEGLVDMHYLVSVLGGPSHNSKSIIYPANSMCSCSS